MDTIRSNRNDSFSRCFEHVFSWGAHSQGRKAKNTEDLFFIANSKVYKTKQDVAESDTERLYK